MPSITYGMILTFGDSVHPGYRDQVGPLILSCSIWRRPLCINSDNSEVLNYRFYWPTIFTNAYQFVSTCKKCQKMSRRHEIPQEPILFCEVFDVWGIDFMVPFLISNGYSYVLLVFDYVSRWVEAIAIDESHFIHLART
ncbi:putative mitochondrial protein, partial [Mucuna pruriens]